MIATDVDGDRRTMLEDGDLDKVIRAGDLYVEQAPPPVPAPNRISVRLPFLVTAWIVAWLALLGPKPFARFRFWIVNILYRGYGFASAVFGPWLAKDSANYRNRMAACGGCESARLVLARKAPFVKTYCGQCQCPRWPVSELALKNRFQNWACPVGLFKGRSEPVEWDAVREAEETWKTERIRDIKTNGKQPPIVRGGCGGHHV